MWDDLSQGACPSVIQQMLRDMEVVVLAPRGEEDVGRVALGNTETGKFNFGFFFINTR
jgi:hypothetical protein